MLPHNAPFVLSLSVTGQYSLTQIHPRRFHQANHTILAGHLSTRPAPPSTPSSPSSPNFPSSLALAIDSWPNLQSVRFTPETSHEETFTQALLSLSSRTLSHLYITSRITPPADVLGLENLTVDDPNRTYREVLPGWVGRLEGTLRGLHLQVLFSSLVSRFSLPM